MTPVVDPELAFECDGTGRAHPAQTITSEATGSGFVFVWLLQQGDDAGLRNTLTDLGLDDFVRDALLADETRPRCTVHGDGALVNLRGVNLNAGAEPEDMISARLWVSERRVIGVWRRPLKAVADLFDAMARNQAPTSPGDLVARLALRLADRAEPTVAALNETIDGLEEALLDDLTVGARPALAQVRRRAITLRRYMFPLRDALTTLEIEDLNWLTQQDRSRLREAAERVTRMAEELDAIRDRAQVVQDQIMDKRAEVMNRQMLLLSIVAAIFLPLGLLTGLLGINVGGMPGADNPSAFWVVCGLLTGAAVMLVILFRWLGLLRR
ncbi:MAG: zinc transporter ZntB [Jannaschia sp.]